MYWLLFLFIGLVNTLEILVTKELLIQEYAANLRSLFALLAPTLRNAQFLSRLFAVRDLNFAKLYAEVDFEIEEAEEWLKFCIENPVFIPRILHLSFLIQQGYISRSKSLCQLTSNIIKQYPRMVFDGSVSIRYIHPEFQNEILKRAVDDASTIIENHKFCRLSLELALANDWWKYYSSLCLSKTVGQAITVETNMVGEPDDVLKTLRVIFTITLAPSGSDILKNLKNYIFALLQSKALEKTVDYFAFVISVVDIWLDNDSDPEDLYNIYGQMKGYITDNTEANSLIRTSFMIDLLISAILRGITEFDIFQDFQNLVSENGGNNLRAFNSVELKHLYELLNKIFGTSVNEFFESEIWKGLTARIPHLIPIKKLPLQDRLQKWHFRYRALFSKEPSLELALIKLAKDEKLKVFANKDFPEILRAHTEDILESNDDGIINSAVFGNIILSAMANNVKLPFPSLKDLLSVTFQGLQERENSDSDNHAELDEFTETLMDYKVYEFFELQDLLDILL